MLLRRPNQMKSCVGDADDLALAAHRAAILRPVGIDQAARDVVAELGRIVTI